MTDTTSPPARLRWARLYGRLALGAAFLSGVAARFGLWGSRSSWKNFADFVRYTASVNSFMPAWTIPFLAWAATAAELTLGLALVLGLRPRLASLGSAALLALFALAMTISFGIKEPLDYSVYSASAAALMLALSYEPVRPTAAAAAIPRGPITSTVTGP